MYQPNHDRTTTITNRTLIITAVTCLLGLILTVGTGALISRWIKDRSNSIVESAEVVKPSAEPKLDLTEFQEGYAMVLPTGFKQESREETQRGYIVYRFRSEQGYQFTFAVIPDESIDRFTPPPGNYPDALVKSVKELSQGIDGELLPERVMTDGMSASLFRYYEKETYRGVTFTYYMVVMDRGRKLVLKFAGKYGGYKEKDDVIAWPDHWYDALMTLEHVRPPAPTEKAAIQK